MKDRLSEIERRLANIEENTRLLLISDVIGDLEETEGVLEEDMLADWLERHRMIMEKSETVSNHKIVFLSFLDKAGLKQIRATASEFIQEFELIPVFVFDSLTTAQKRALFNEKYSYVIRNKEQHLFL